MNIALRCDGTTALGLGHVTECLALARSLAERVRGRITFLMQRGSPGATLASGAGYDCVLLDPAAQDRELAAWLREQAPDMLIVNLPNRPASYYQRLMAAVPHMVAIFDDGRDHNGLAHQVVDYAVDQRWPADGLDNAAALLGPQFALLDEAFRKETAQPRDVPELCRRLLVTQGGSDPFHLTVKVVQALARLPVKQDVVVVLGAAAEPALVQKVESLIPLLPFSCRPELAVEPVRFRALMQEADLAVTAAGNTLYELCALGVPALVVAHHPRHQAVAEAFARHGAVRSCGIGTMVSIEQIAENVRSLLDDAPARRNLSRRGWELVDGLGCVRVASALTAAVEARCASS